MGYQRYADEMGLESTIIATEDVVLMVGLWCGLVQGSRRPRMRKVGAEEAWRQHIINNHQPYRRDCALCLRNGGVGRQHRATPNPRAYVLSIDVAGPLRKKEFRYFLLGAYRYPKMGCESEGGHPIPDEPPDDEPPVPPPEEPPFGDEEDDQDLELDEDFEEKEIVNLQIQIFLRKRRRRRDGRIWWKCSRSRSSWIGSTLRFQWKGARLPVCFRRCNEWSWTSRLSAFRSRGFMETVLGNFEGSR